MIERIVLDAFERDVPSDEPVWITEDV
jgi:hypothetical protein